MRAQRFLLASVATACSFAASGLVADTVHLKNGRQIEGKIIDNRQTTGEVIVEIGTSGRVMLRGHEVEKIAKGEVGEALQRERVAVKIPGSEVYSPSTGAIERTISLRDDKTIVLDLDEGGKARIERRPGVDLDTAATRTIEGTLSALSDDKTIVLDVAEGTRMRIARGPGVEVKKVETTAEPKPAAALIEEGGKKKIRTTHAIYLKNGRKLQGSLVPTAESEPVKLDVGSLGRMTIARSQVAADGIKAESGTIDLPEEPKAAPTETTPPPQATPPAAAPQTPEELRRQMREEVLQEIFQLLLEGRTGAAASVSRAASEAVAGPTPHLAPERQAAIQQAVSELGRQRNQNRVRAERHLVSFGRDALPYLEGMESHPFELTRRAVQRIVRDIGSVDGAPLAIEGLTDIDDFVRVLAREALVKVLPSSIAYNPEGSETDRLRAQAEYQHLWDTMVLEHARDSLLQALASQR